MTRAVAVALCGLLVLAGCSAVGGSGERGPTPTLTPAPVPVPDDPATNDGPDRPAFLQRPVAPWDIGDAHAATLSGSNYTWVFSRNVTTYRVDHPNSGREAVRVVRVANATTYRVDRRIRATNYSGPSRWRSATTEYAIGGLAFERRPPTGTVRGRPVEQPRNGEGVIDDRAEALVARYLDTDRRSVVRFREDGERRYLVRGRGAPPSLPPLANDSVSGYRVTALLRPDGRVAVLRARWREGSRTVVTIRSEYRAVGSTTVTAPEWFANVSRPQGEDRRAGDSADDWFVDAEIRAAAAYRSGGNESVEVADPWVGWPEWARDD